MKITISNISFLNLRSFIVDLTYGHNQDIIPLLLMMEQMPNKDTVMISHIRQAVQSDRVQMAGLKALSESSLTSN